MNLSFSQSDAGSSFFDLLRQREPALLPQFAAEGPEPREAVPPVPIGTTVLALRYQDGVVVAGDRQATEGYQVASRRIEKVYAADDHSAIAIAGAAGPCLEMARLFQTELAHYEKIEGMVLSLEGKANKLAQMVRANLPLAIQGLVVIPIFVGYDLRRDEGRIYKYDLAGGRYDEAEYYAIGSGGKDARATMKKLYRPAMPEADADPPGGGGAVRRRRRGHRDRRAGFRPADLSQRQAGDAGRDPGHSRGPRRLAVRGDRERAPDRLRSRRGRCRFPTTSLPSR